MDLALNSLQRLICHKTQPKKERTPPFSEAILLEQNVIEVNYKQKKQNTLLIFVSANLIN